MTWTCVLCDRGRHADCAFARATYPPPLRASGCCCCDRPARQYPGYEPGMDSRVTSSSPPLGSFQRRRARRDSRSEDPDEEVKYG